MKKKWLSMADPIHGMIRLARHNENHQMLLDVVNSRAFQRLRRIKQMGMAEFVFPGATHSRFVHSFGSAWLMVKTVDHMREFPEFRQLLESTFLDTGITIERILLLSILVHDIGHTPLSHTLEDILDLKERGMFHDSYWNKLILTQDEDLQRIWQRYGARLPEAMFRFLGEEDPSERHYLADLVSSQLDMDRLDYLQRDSHYMGVQYGRIELERIITNLCVGITPEGKKAVAIREEALPAVEHYLFGRFEAYKMALHSLDKASEMLLKKTLERFAWARENGVNTGHEAQQLYLLMKDGEALDVDNYLMLDDCYLWDKINLWARYSEDALLKELANRLLRHDLLKYVEISQFPDDFTAADMEPVFEEMRRYYEKRNLPFEFCFDELIVIPKHLYQPATAKAPIWVRLNDGQLKDFADVTSLPLKGDIRHGRRWMIFVWDGQAKAHLRRVLESRFDTPVVGSPQVL